MNSQKRYMTWGAAAAAAVIVWVLMPMLLSQYYLHVLNIALINVILVVGLNYFLGYGGQMSLAQAAFFGMGGYGYSVLAIKGVPLPLALLFGVVLAGAVAFLIAAPILKLKGHYLALATLGFNIISTMLMVNLKGITRGADGINNIPTLIFGGDKLNPEPMIWAELFPVAVLLLVLAIVFNRSPLGMRARAMRDDELAADMMGVNVAQIKTVLFTFSGAYAGLAGVLYAGMLGYISPDVFRWDTTFNYLIMNVIGGLGSAPGAAIGAILLTLLPEWLRFLKEAYMAIFGIAVIVIQIAAPGGLAGLMGSLGARIRRSAVPATSTTAGK